MPAPAKLTLVQPNVLGIVTRTRLCRMLECCTATVRKWESEGLPVRRFGALNYYHLSEVQEFIEARRTVRRRLVRSGTIRMGYAAEVVHLAVE